MSDLNRTAAYSDIEGGLQAWFKTLPAITALVAQRIFQGMPRKGPSAYPVITLFRVGGGPEEGDYPIDGAHVQIDCWGNPGDKLRTQGVAQAVISALLSMQCGTLLSSNVRGLGVYGINTLYLPDPGTGQSRYSVDCKVQCQAV